MLLRSFVAILSLAAARLASSSPVNVTSVSASVAAQDGYQNAVYFPNWAIYGRNYQPDALPASRISHVLYAFLNLRANGEVYSGDLYADVDKRYPTDSWDDTGRNAYGCVKQLYLLKRANRRMKTLLSIGGWTWSTNFPAAASSEAGRSLFAQSAVGFMKDWAFDGIDIDWEYPSNPTEAANMVLLLRRVRQELDSYAAQHAPGYHFLLTIAAPAGPSHYNVMDLPGIASVVDTIYLMNYDYAGSWDSVSGHQANIYPDPGNPASTPFSSDRAITDYLAAGVPPQKLVMGMPIYGRAFQQTDGLGQPFSGVGEGSWEQGIWDFKDLPRPGAQERYDDVAQASYSYDAGARTLVSYDTPAMIRTKVNYLTGRGLAGSMFWEASGDRTDGDSLILTSFNALGGTGAQDARENQLNYPDSQYDNIRAGLQ